MWEDAQPRWSAEKGKLNPQCETTKHFSNHKSSDHGKFHWGCGGAKRPIHCFWEYKTAQPLWKTILVDFIKRRLNTYIEYDPAILLTSINPRERKVYIHTKTYIQTFIAALFVRRKLETSQVVIWVNR